MPMQAEREAETARQRVKGVGGSQETPFVNRLVAAVTLFLSVTAKIRFWGGG